MPSLGKSLPYLIYPVIGLLVGWSSTAMIPSGKEKGAITQATSSATTRPRESRDAITAPMTPDELFEEARRIVEGPDESGIASYLTDWTDAEILSALSEASVDPDALLRHESMATGLLLELAKRDPERAMRWSLGQSEILRQKFATIALSGWLPDREDDAIATVKKHPEIFGGQLPPKILQACITSASGKGTAAFIIRIRELMEMGPGKHIDINSRLDPSFDFASLLNSPDFAVLGLDTMKESMLETWATRDREAAWQWVLADGGPTAIFQLQKSSWQANYAQSSDMIRWMVGKAESFTPEQQAEFLKMHAAQVRSQPDTSTVWIEAAKNPELRDAFRSAAAAIIYQGSEGSVERALKSVGTLPDPAARLAMLESMDRSTAGGIDRLEPAADRHLRTKLAEWGADTIRTQAIIDHLYPGNSSGPKP
ncbi:MAG: hypothetical protein EOP83_10385 [Verrucomicrobiaceae bacterium]|nr:MAG: hypothetical protein EOP83_10385 [Verrucomicrobiaceae bacterium]